MIWKEEATEETLSSATYSWRLEMKRHICGNHCENEPIETKRGTLFTNCSIFFISIYAKSIASLMFLIPKQTFRNKIE